MYWLIDWLIDYRSPCLQFFCSCHNAFVSVFLSIPFSFRFCSPSFYLISHLLSRILSPVVLLSSKQTLCLSELIHLNTQWHLTRILRFHWPHIRWSALSVCDGLYLAEVRHFGFLKIQIFQLLAGCGLLTPLLWSAYLTFPCICSCQHLCCAVRPTTEPVTWLSCTTAVGWLSVQCNHWCYTFTV